MKKIFLFFLFFVSLTSFVLAQSSSKLRKTAEDLEENKSYIQAADFYYRSLVIKTNNPKAFVGLERTAPKALDSYLKEFSYNYNAEKYEEAANSYQKARDYQLKVNRVGIGIEISNFYIQKYEDTKEILAEKFYQEANQNFEKGNYKLAIEKYQKTLNYKTDYKDANERISRTKEILNSEEAENLYQKALQKFNNKEYRAAYNDFLEVSKRKANYKNTESLKNQALKKGTVRIGIFEFKNDTQAKGAGGTLYSYVGSNIVNYKSPFVQLIERENLDQLLKEQKLGMSGIVDESTAARAGKLIGLDYVLVGRMVSATTSDGVVTNRNIPCYEMFETRNSDGYPIQRSKPTSYTLHEGKSTLVLEAKYQLISVETGQIVLDEILSASESDFVRYATYYGNHTRLMMSDPSRDLYSRRVDQSLFSAKRDLKTIEEMQAPALKKLSEEMVNHLFSKLLL